MLALLGKLWENGWQPSEVVRQARRSADRVAADLATVAILVDDDQRGTQQRDPLWAAQIEFLRQTCADDLDSGWLRRWFEDEPHSRSRSGVPSALFGALSKLGPIHRLIPSPGSDRVDSAQLRAEVDEADPVLSKVRALLNKAESSEYAAEAEAFTAKAQALISRHSLEDLLGDAHDADFRPASIRIPIDEPYVNAKASLLHVVAEASRCRSIQLADYAMCSLTGRPRDIRRVEILFTSLLVQAQSALNEVGRADAPGSQFRSRSFRSSFLSGYASRIGQRLADERDRTTQSFGSDALPVLARVDSAVDEEVDRLFGDCLSSAKSGRYNALGWGTGVDSANKAQIRDGGLGSTAPRAAEVVAERSTRCRLLD
ncbi:MAG: DUF2786 domain-containing protein [Actinobacteria bacterium]|nr:DUF2786 domain-containing protein [Actinomycetota bacterium]